MFWINFLHFYQPANSDFSSIREALDKSYWRLLRLLEEHPDLRFTANISGCLLERLAEEKQEAFLDRLRFLVKKGRLELVGSAAYHGFLPFLPEAEVIRQIKANEKILQKHFGKSFRPSGFFFPEMAYTPELATIVKRLGYRWIILDEIHTAVKIHPGQQYLDSASGLRVVFRDQAMSNAYPPDQLLPFFKEWSTRPAVATAEVASALITATDAELYGLRHEDPTGELERLAKLKGLKTITISEFLKIALPRRPEKIALRAASWESSPAEIKQGQPFRLWRDSHNKIQANLWKLAFLALKMGDKFRRDQNFYWHRWHLERGLASCSFWWASGRDFSRVYGPYAWSPDDIERGLEDLVRSIRSFADPKSKAGKLEAEKYYLKIKKLVWEAHWKKYWRKIA
jgi:predicted glycosyl hydrolase (DUF1957 family)